MFETKRLRYFVQIAQDGSLSKAAESLQIAQPALSRQLQLLEDYLGFALFIRTGRGMKITREGVLLLNSVAGPLREIELSVENMRSFMSWVEMPISVGVHPEIAPHVAEPLAAIFEKELPKAKLRLQQAPSEVLADWLKQGSLDFAIQDYPAPDESVKDRLVCRHPLVLVGFDDALDKINPALDINVLTELPLILPCVQNGVRKVLDLAAGVAVKKLTPVCETDVLALTLARVCQRRGFAVMAASSARQLDKEMGLSMRTINGKNLQIGTYVCHRNNGSAEASVVAQADYLIESTLLSVLQDKS